MEDEFDALRHEFFEVMHELHQVRHASQKSLGDVTPVQGRVLHAVCMLEGRPERASLLRSGAMANRLHITPSAFSQVLKSLEEKGLVERRRGGSDCRAVTVSATEKGRALAQEMDAYGKRSMREMIEYVGADDLRAMLATARRIVGYYRQAADGVPSSPAGEQTAEGGAPCA